MTSWDIFFISYQENNCEENWQRVRSLHPNAKRIHGVKGIDKVHLICEQLSTTEFFWTIDGDNRLDRSLEYTATIDTDLVMFKAVDPFDGEPTLLGGVKLWRTGSIINRDMSKADFSLNATKTKKVVDVTLSTVLHNSTPYDAWKTAFRHCVKLMTVIFRSRPNARNLDSYINRWADTKHSQELNANWAYLGYLDAREYADQFDNQLEELNKINDYTWLENYFREKHGTS